MKKYLLMLLCGALMLSFFACGEPKKTEPPKKDPPDWEELIEEYDEWATEYVTFRRAYKANPTNPVIMDSIGRWPNNIKEWGERTAEMLNALKDFKEEKNAYVAELKRISQKLTDIATDEVTSDEVDAFLAEYDAWADEYVAFFEAHKDDKTSQEYRSGLNDLIFETSEWSNKINNMNLRIEDSALLTSFTAEIAKIAGKLWTANN